MLESERVLTVLREAVPRVDWEDSRPLMEAGLLDSLDVLMIVSALNQAFGIRLPSTELTAANFNSAEAILALCLNYAKESARQ